MTIYNPHSKCPKCGGLAEEKYDEPTDTIKRTCKRCGHVWTEEPLDSQKENP